MYKSKLEETTKRYGTDFWNDSCSIHELKYALEYGAVGATTNPVIVKTVVEQEFETYQPIIAKFIKENPQDTEDDIAWRLIEHTAIEGAKLLEEIYLESKGQKGRISIQSSSKYFRSAEKMINQAVYFNTLAPNIQVKMPATKEGIIAFEEATFQGVSINATVSFSVSQAIAVAEAIERGMKRRNEAGLDSTWMHPVCTIMVGRAGDWVKETTERDGLKISEEALDLVGVSVMKHAYTLFKERKFRTSLLAAAYRNDNQWLEFVGGDIELTIPHLWIRKFNEGDYSISERMSHKVDDRIIDELRINPEFSKVYDENGMREEDFINFGATQKTLNQFFQGYDDLVRIVRKEQLIMEEIGNE